MGLIFVMFILAAITIAIIKIYNITEEPGALKVILGLAAFIMFAVWFRGYSTSYYNERVVTCTVTEKDRGSDNGSYRIYTKECGVLANTDSFYRGKYNSADVWAEIPESGKVTVRVVGARIPLYSMFPNILEVVEED